MIFLKNRFRRTKKGDFCSKKDSNCDEEEILSSMNQNFEKKENEVNQSFSNFQMRKGIHKKEKENDKIIAKNRFFLQKPIKKIKREYDNSSCDEQNASSHSLHKRSKDKFLTKNKDLIDSKELFKNSEEENRKRRVANVKRAVEKKNSQSIVFRSSRRFETFMLFENEKEIFENNHMLVEKVIKLTEDDDCDSDSNHIEKAIEKISSNMVVELKKYEKEVKNSKK